MSELAVNWIFVLDEEYVYNISRYLPVGWDKGCAFVDHDGCRRLEIHPNGDARILANYAWDGCTPKFSVFDVVIGVPDGVPNQVTKRPKAYYASLLHDALYQFLDADLPLSRGQADGVFLEAPGTRSVCATANLLCCSPHVWRHLSSLHSLEEKLCRKTYSSRNFTGDLTLEYTPVGRRRGSTIAMGERKRIVRGRTPAIVRDRNSSGVRIFSVASETPSTISCLSFGDAKERNVP